MNQYKDYIPFNIYDFFGYLFPGIFFFMNVYAILHLTQPTIIENIFYFCEQHNSVFPFLTTFFLIITILSTVYIVGHIIATLSHIFIDRIFIAGVIGYPVRRLLKLNHEDQPHANLYVKSRSRYGQGVYKFISSLLFILLSTPLILHYVVESPEKLDICVTMIAYLALILTIAKIVAFSINKYRSTWYEYILFKNKYTSYLIRLVFDHVPKFTFDIILIWVERIIQTDRGFEPQFLKHFKQKFESKFHINTKVSDTENYWLPFYEILSKSEAHSKIIMNWLHLYSFARNMAACGYIVCCLIIIVLINGFNLDNLTVNNQVEVLKKNDTEKYLTYLYTFNFIAANMFFVRFWVLYATYFTKGIIRSFYTLNSDSDSTTTSNEPT